MSKSLIYTENPSTQALALDSIIDLGSVIRRYGQNTVLEGNSIRLCGEGYYKVDATITVLGTTAGPVTITLLENGVPVASSEATLVADEIKTIPLIYTARLYKCCVNNNSRLTFALSGTAETVENIKVIVEKS